MNAHPLPFNKVLFVCTHQRGAGERIACANPGRDGQHLRDELKRKVKENGWDTQVRVCASGCQDRCEEGPNAVLTTATGQSQWFSQLTRENLPSLLDRLAASPPPPLSK